MYSFIVILTRIRATHFLRRIRPARAADRLRNFLQYLKEHVPSGLVAPGQLIDVPNSHSERPKSFERCRSLIRYYSGSIRMIDTPT